MIPRPLSASVAVAVALFAAGAATAHAQTAAPSSGARRVEIMQTLVELAHAKQHEVQWRRWVPTVSLHGTVSYHGAIRAYYDPSSATFPLGDGVSVSASWRLNDMLDGTAGRMARLDLHRAELEVAALRQQHDEVRRHAAARLGYLREQIDLTEQEARLRGRETEHAHLQHSAGDATFEQITAAELAEIAVRRRLSSLREQARIAEVGTFTGDLTPDGIADGATDDLTATDSPATDNPTTGDR